MFEVTPEPGSKGNIPIISKLMRKLRVFKGKEAAYVKYFGGKSLI